jgi:parvulin-like peptidyl-prolyl isomerase
MRISLFIMVVCASGFVYAQPATPVNPSSSKGVTPPKAKPVSSKLQQQLKLREAKINQKTSKMKVAQQPKVDEKPLPPVVGKDGLIARVNGQGIALKLFSEKYSRFSKTFKARKRKVPNKIAQRYRDSIVKRLIEEELIKQESQKQQIQVPAADLDAEYKKYKTMFKGEDRFQRYLKTAKLSEAQIKENLKSSLALKLLLAKVSGGQTKDSDVEKYYNDNIKKYEVKEQVRASHILIKVPKGAKADQDKVAQDKATKLTQQARNGGDFAKLAQENSEGPTKTRGGDLNFFQKGRMVKEFDQVAFNLKVGEISDPVKTRFGWHVIKVTDKKTGRIREFKEVKDNIKKMLENRNSRKARSELLKRLKESAKVDNYLP